MAAVRNTQRNWTLMVYLAGDNNLDSAGVADLKEMKTVGSTDRIAVLAQFDRAGGRGETVRYCLNSGTPLDKDAVQRLGETNMGDPKVLEDFVTWGVTNYPAEHYLLVLWNHGAGWDDANIYQGDVFSGAAPPVSRKSRPIVTRGAAAGARVLPLAQARAGIRRTRRALFSTTVEAAVKQRGIAYDDQAQDFLDNIELKRVMTRIKRKLRRKIDILGMDACLMSMAEVAYQLRDVADYSVASEESEPGDGWPYDRILKALAAKPTMTPEDHLEDHRRSVPRFLQGHRERHSVGLEACRAQVPGRRHGLPGKGPQEHPDQRRLPNRPGLRPGPGPGVQPPIRRLLRSPRPR